jgi:orotidine 5'-phosphate decarboxylase subfamily 1
MLTYEQRIQHCPNLVSKTLLALMSAKESNLCVNPDLTSCEEVLAIADQVGPSICVLKTHVDIISDFTPAFITDLQRLAKKHQFLIFEDRKFADIGNTVKLQYEHGIYHIADWARITNAHPLPGPGVIDGLKSVGLPKGNALLLLAQMSSKDNLITPEYTRQTVALALQHPDFVIGFIAQQRLTDAPHLIHFTPGVKLQSGTDALGQQYNTPERAILQNGVDVIIVGRGIFEAGNPAKEAEMYREAGWDAYLRRLIT